MNTLLYILANEDSEWPVQLLVVAFLMIIAAAGKVLEKMKQKPPSQPPSPQRRRPGQTPTRPAESSGESVEDIVRTMRQAQRRQQPQPAPTAQPRQVPRSAQARKEASLSERYAEPELRVESVPTSHKKRKRKVRTRHVGTMREQASQAVAVSRGLQINLNDLDEARKAIVYSEILGPPMALREHGGMWDE